MNELIEFLIKAKQKTYAEMGTETICYQGKQIYECYFHGSVIK